MQREFLNSIALAAAVIVLAAGSPWLVHELRTLPRPAALAARADQRVVTIDIGGMTCAGCAAKVKSQLALLPGVSAAEVRLAQRQAYVVCGKSVPDSALTGAIHRAGPGFLASVASR